MEILTWQRASNAVWNYRYSDAELQQIFANTSEIFTDLDGTLILDPKQGFTKETIEGFRALNAVGIVPTFLTGKPYAEARKVLESLPADIHAKMMFERGAYLLVPNNTQKYTKEYLLSNPAIEATITQLKHEFWNNAHGIRQRIEESYHITIEKAGDGTHESIFSIDILKQGKRIEESLDTHRMDIKIDVSDPVLAALKADLSQYLEVSFPACSLTDLGNANLEITVRQVDKDIAIEQTLAFKEGKGILVWGDSGNDEHMMRLRRFPHVHAGVVFHAATPDVITDQGDFFAVGKANGLPFIHAVVAAKKAAT